MISCIKFNFSCFPSNKKNKINIETDFEKIKKMWADVPSAIQEHTHFCHFLYRSRLIFTMLGYKTSLEKDEQNNPRAMQNPIWIHEGEPHLQFKGQWEKWSDIAKKIRYDEKTKEIVSIDNESEIWSYYYNPFNGKMGLQPTSRFGTVEPRYQLSKEQMQSLGITQENPCLLQAFSSDNCLIPKLSHIGLRLISSNGWVYSLGYETLLTDLSFKKQSLAGTYNVGISALDYDEFAKFKIRRVTTTPITEEGFERALDKIKYYSQKKLRFNRFHQNCVTYHLDVMRHAVEPGFKNFPDVKISILSLGWDLITDKIPYLNSALKTTLEVKRKVVFFISKVPLIGIPFRCVSYIGKKFSIFSNSLILIALGGTKGSAPKAAENEIDNSQELTHFDRLYSAPSHLFDEKRSTIYSVKKFVDWQLEQKSTIIYPYEGPKFYIAPFVSDHKFQEEKGVI